MSIGLYLPGRRANAGHLLETPLGHREGTPLPGRSTGLKHCSDWRRPDSTADLATGFRDRGRRKEYPAIANEVGTSWGAVSGRRLPHGGQMVGRQPWPKLWAPLMMISVRGGRLVELLDRRVLVFYVTCWVDDPDAEQAGSDARGPRHPAHRVLPTPFVAVTRGKGVRP